MIVPIMITASRKKVPMLHVYDEFLSFQSKNVDKLKFYEMAPRENLRLEVKRLRGSPNARNSNSVSGFVDEHC